MIAGGIAGCADFREGGPQGVSEFQGGAAGLPFRSLIFGREGGEMAADGLGISSIRDVPDTERLVMQARHAGKKIAFHAGERDAADIDDAIAFEPDLLIHATHATKKQLRDCAEKDIPIAVCPRSNWALGVTASPRYPPLRQMLDAGCTLCLGTDNVMFVAPDMFSEMAFCSLVYGLEPKTLLHAAIQGSELAGPSFFIRRGTRANLFFIDPAQSLLRYSRNPLISITKRASGYRIGNNVFNL
jgi:cytosine/adenosine deaminase-related metal-dependent hydrolase